MTRFFSFSIGVATCIAFLAAPATGDDEKEKGKFESQSTTPTPIKIDKGKAPEFAGYSYVSTIYGEVVKANDKTLTLRVFWPALSVKNGKSTRGTRPSLHSTHHNSINPYTTRRPQVQVTWEHHDYALDFVSDSLVRMKTLPTKYDVDGKKSFYSEKERDELKVPYSVPGYQATKNDLTPGTVVEVFIIRDKTIAKDKLTDADMKVKYAIIHGQDPNPPKDIVSPSTSGTTTKKN